MSTPHRLPCFLICILLLSALLDGCGGGNGTSATTNPPPLAPVLSSIVPSSVMAGASDITIQANGTNFSDSSIVQWNSSALQTTFVSGSQLTAVVPAADLTNVGTAQVRISSNQSGTTDSAALTFTIAAVQPHSTWIRTLNYMPNDIAWDAGHGKILASMGSNDAIAPNSLLVIDPVSAQVVTTAPAGNDPNLLSVSSDHSYLWVGQDGNSSVQRFTLPDLQPDVSITLPPNTYGIPPQAVSLEAARNNPHTIAVDAGHWGYSPPGWNIYVFDDAVQRTESIGLIGAGLPYIDWLQWGKDDSTVYGTQYTTIDSPGGVVSMAVTSSGITKLPGDGGFPGGTGMYSYFSPSTGLMYSYSTVADPPKLANVGEYDLFGEIWQCVPDANLGRYFCAVEPQLYGPGAELWVFDLARFNLLDRVDLSGVVTGSFGRLIRWGQAGLALISTNDVYGGNGGLFLIDGAAVNPNSPPDSLSGTGATDYPLMLALQPESAPAGSGDVKISISGQNFTPDSVACWTCSYLQLRTVSTTYESSARLSVTIPASVLQSPGPLLISIYDPVRNSFATNSLTFTVLPSSNGSNLAALNLDGLATAWDNTASRLYVGTGGLDRAYPSSIVVIDPTTATISNSVQVSPFPDLLSISAQDRFLYIGFGGATLETQLALPGLTPAVSWALSNPSFLTDTAFGDQFYAGDLHAAPQNPSTSVVTLFNYAFSPSAIGGVTIYDGQIQRENIAPGWVPSGNDIDVLAWGNKDSILLGSSNDFEGLQTDYLFNVDASGVSLASSGPSSFNAGGAAIHSDFGTGLVYSDDGNVADPTTGQVVGSIAASGIVLPYSPLNRIFVLTQTEAQSNTNDYTIASFDQTTYMLVATITVQNLLGLPFSLRSCGDHCLAVLTFNENWSSYGGPVGMLYLVRDQTFISNELSRNATSLSELGKVALRYNPPSRKEILNREKLQDDK